jgi:anti-anti-sigma factor
MSVTVSQANGRVPVVILHAEGSVDGSNYTELIAKAQEAYDAGARDLLLDFSKVTFMSSAGIIALHRIVHILRGDKPSHTEEGQAASRAIDREEDSGLEQHIKLLNPQPAVESVLDLTGLKQHFAIFTDLEKALAAF